LSPSEKTYYAQLETQELTKAVQLCPLEVKYQLYLGLAYEKFSQMHKTDSQNLLKEALKHYQKAVEMSPANAYYYNDEGRICDTLSYFDPIYLNQAQQAYRLSVKLAPSSPFFLINWALSLDKTGRKNESQEALQKAFKIDPGFSSKILSQMALKEYDSGNKEKAFDYLNKTIQFYDLSAETFYYRGIFYLDQKKKKLALKDFLEAKKLNPAIGRLEDLIAQSRH